MGGDKEARRGIVELTGQRSWLRAAEVWRMWLFSEADGRSAIGDGAANETGVGNQEDGKSGKGVRHGVSLEKKADVLAKRGKMSVGELIRCRVRHFSDGAVLGRKEFVAEYRKRDEDDRRRVPVVRGLDCGENGERLCSMRDLRIDAIRPPPGTLGNAGGG